MPTLLALAGWPDVPMSPGAWSGTDATGAPLVLGYAPDGVAAAENAAAGSAVAVNEDRSVRAVLAGAIYNRRELRASLGGRHAFSGRDDAEIVVHLYEERGVQGITSLRGAFAFALWDGRRRRLLLARDHLGLVPLYYANERGRLAAASALPPLAGLPGLAASWDATALDALLVLGTVPPPATLHPAIRQLHPGELVVWEDDKLRPQRYWKLTFPERRVAAAAVGGMLREQLRDALRLRQAGVMSGLLLSGGLDAAAVLALTISEHRPPTRTFTAAVPGARHDESHVAARLALRSGVEHVTVTEAPDWSGAVEALVAAQVGPLAGLDAPALRAAASRAAGDVRAVLAGAGGEEIFGGSGPVRAAERIRFFHRLPDTVREGTEMIGRLAPGLWAQRLARLVQEQRFAPLELYGRRVSVFLPEERDELYTVETGVALGESQPWAALTGFFSDAVAAGANDTADILHYVEVALRLPARVAALTAAAGSLELLLPFADHRVAQLIASVAPAERGGPRTRQLALQTAMAGLLPAAILRRPHTASVPGREAWRSGSLHELMEETLAPERLAARGVFRPETVTRLRREHESGRRDHAARLWAILLAARCIERQVRPAASTLRAAG